MWKNILVFLFAILLATPAANAFEYEYVRTKEAPGYFLVQMFVDDSLPVMRTQDVFVKNYPSMQAKRYEQIFYTIEELGGRIIEVEELDELPSLDRSRVVVLGKPIEPFLNFRLTKDDEPLDTFEEFSNQYLTPVLFQGIETYTGGNVTDIYSDSGGFVGYRPVTFVGKFDKPQKTLFRLTGLTANGFTSIDIPLDLSDQEAANSPWSESLPMLWDELRPKPFVEEPSDNFFGTFFWRQLFPVILVVLAFFCFFWIFSWAQRARQEEDVLAEMLWKESPESIEKSATKPDTDNLPFEIVFEENKDGVLRAKQDQ